MLRTSLLVESHFYLGIASQFKSNMGLDYFQTKKCEEEKMYLIRCTLIYFKCLRLYVIVVNSVNLLIAAVVTTVFFAIRNVRIQLSGVGETVLALQGLNIQSLFSFSFR
jgi:hypothetical protein